MSDKNRKLQSPAATKVIHQEYFSGPLPSPQVLQGFEDVHPGAADRIIAMAEEESLHRRSMERRTLSSMTNNERIGMALAFLICIVALLGGFYCVLKGHPAAGTIISACPLAIIVSTFIQGRKK